MQQGCGGRGGATLFIVVKNIVELESEGRHQPILTCFVSGWLKQ